MITPAVNAAAVYASRLHVDRCTTERDEGGSDDPYGAPAQAWGTVLDGVACRLWVETGSTSTSDDRTTVLADWRMSVAGDADLKEGDRVTSVVGPDGSERLPEILWVDWVARHRSRLVARLERR